MSLRLGKGVLLGAPVPAEGHAGLDAPRVAGTVVFVGLLLPPFSVLCSQ